MEPVTQPTACVFYKRDGVCPYGERCWFAHISPPPLCRFFATTSGCRFGDRCLFRHVTPRQEAAACAICLEDPRRSAGGRFGVLNGCSHVFCLACIMEWRAARQGNSRSCPLCRVKSDFVVPSRHPVDPEEREAFIERFVQEAADKNCKFFDKHTGKSSCPFGRKCFYAHVTDAGVDVKPTESEFPMLLRPGRRSSRRIFPVGDADDDEQILLDIDLLDSIFASGIIQRLASADQAEDEHSSEIERAFAEEENDLVDIHP